MFYLLGMILFTALFFLLQPLIGFSGMFLVVTAYMVKKHGRGGILYVNAVRTLGFLGVFLFFYCYREAAVQVPAETLWIRSNIIFFASEAVLWIGNLIMKMQSA